MNVESTSAPKSSNGAARPTKATRRKFDTATKKAAVARVHQGESGAAVAASIPVVHSVLHRWVKAFPKAKTKPQKKQKKKKAQRRYTEAQQRAAAQRVQAGESAVTVP